MDDWSRPAVAALLAECGRIALAHYERPRVSVKDDRTVVTEADRQIEGLLAAELDRPSQGSWLIGEETVASKDESYLQAALAGRAWVVDPIDGTAPYSHHIPTWGISLALARGGRLEQGAILLPATDELFVSEGDRVYYGRGGSGGAPPPEPADITGVARGGRELGEHGIIAITQEMAKWGRVDLPNQVQALGTAVLPLSYLCLGRYEGYIGRLKLWDFAGALPLLAKCGMHVKLRGHGWLDGTIGPAMVHTAAGHPHRWRAVSQLVASRSRAIVERLCAAIVAEEGR
jgi:fructose-1,6-bisphosphatase/inositol monophosphatase family enzyme